MKIRIKDTLPRDMFPARVSELLVGCEVSLETMMNPHGEDRSNADNFVHKIAGILELERDIRHSVDVEMILAAIGQKHGAVVEQEILELLARTYGGVFIMSTIGIPAVHCEVIPN